MKKSLALILILLLGLTTACGSNNADASNEQNESLVPIMMEPNAYTQNPYMASSENGVHNDSYSSDVTNAVLPLSIDSVINTSLETENPQAPSAAFYDQEGDAISPYNGGIAIADMEGETITRKGVFVPAKHDGQQYRVQISYSFVDCNDNVVLPTTHGHIIVLQTKDEEGNILPVFKKIMDVDVVALAKAQFGEDIDQNLLSIVYDYSGNLWFVTGGFRIIPEQSPAGFLGYISREYIDAVQSGKNASAAANVHLYKLTDGESAENGISSSEHGAVILTNKACYMLNAENGVKVEWKSEYGSNGTNDAQKDSDYTGGGLAYGSGTTPTLTKDLVLFTDNLDPINLIALSAGDGEEVARVPVLDKLGDDVPVSVENSILVYSGSEERVSVIICNWFGAGNAGLSDPDADSSVQTYANIYDQNWMNKGNMYIAPGVERVDIVKDGDSYKGEKVWLREDIRDTSMIKLSTATGYLYGYWQNMDTEMWCYEVLDFESGKTVCEVPVSKLPQYNNVAVGMIPDVGGNALFCPTNNMEMVCWQDNFAYLPASPAKQLSLNKMERTYLTKAQINKMIGEASDKVGGKKEGGTKFVPETYLMGATVQNIAGKNEIAFKVNGLDKEIYDYKLLYMNADGKLLEYDGDWRICNADGEELSVDVALEAKNMQELRVTFEDGGILDLDDSENNTRLKVMLVSEG